MKSILTILSVLMLSITTLNAQTIRIVNNNPGAPTGPHVYTTVPAAIAAANSGDILHIVPSPQSYGDFTIDKSLKIYGIGFNPDKDVREISQAGTIQIQNGTSNVTVEGLHMQGLGIGSSSNITIRKNRITGGTFALSNETTLKNILFQGNICSGSVLANNQMTTIFNIDGFVITNNVFTNTVNISGKDGMVISHNLFYGSGAPAFNVLFNSVVTNNVFYGAHTRGNNVQNTLFSNNLVFGNPSNAFPVGSGFTNSASGNLIGVDPNFVGFTRTSFEQTTWSFDWDLTLAADSPAKTGGIGGAELGIFGGATPFDMTGVPLPLLQTLTIPAVIGSDQDLNVTIRARGTRNN